MNNQIFDTAADDCKLIIKKLIVNPTDLDDTQNIPLGVIISVLTQNMFTLARKGNMKTTTALNRLCGIFDGSTTADVDRAIDDVRRLPSLKEEYKYFGVIPDDKSEEYENRIETAEFAIRKIRSLVKDLIDNDADLALFHYTEMNGDFQIILPRPEDDYSMPGHLELTGRVKPVKRQRIDNLETMEPRLFFANHFKSRTSKKERAEWFENLSNEDKRKQRSKTEKDFSLVVLKKKLMKKPITKILRSKLEKYLYIRQYILQSPRD